MSTNISDETFVVVGQPASSEAVNDFCSEIEYVEVDYVHFETYMRRFAQANHQGCLPLFFGMPPGSWQLRFPPTDVGLPAGLPPLKLGVHYAQNSTDRISHSGRRWRSRYGFWAKSRGQIWLAPWIQSTETVIITWDGIKRSWGDDENLDDDPLLLQAIEEYVRWKHADRYDKDSEEAGRAMSAYIDARTMLIHQCREETRERQRETSHARSSVPSLTTLYYNTAQTASGSCPDGSHPTSVTIPAGSVNSTVSVADANQKAKNQAEIQVQAHVDAVCNSNSQTFSSAEQRVTVSCSSDATHPPPDGNPVTFTLPAGSVQSTSQADADSQALAIATAQAQLQLRCTYWNAEQTYTATCESDATITVTKVIGAHNYFSTLSQEDADAKAHTEAQNQAQSGLTGAGCTGGIFGNTPQSVQVSYTYFRPRDTPHQCTLHGTVFVAGNYVYAGSQVEANTIAQERGHNFGLSGLVQLAQAGVCDSSTHPFQLP